jgi:hypothetical protein
MSSAQERDSKSKVVEEVESEREEHEEERREFGRAEQEDLNQGFCTGTHDSTRLGVKWGRAYRVRTRAARPS